MRDEQVRRYARHILLPDVGGLGQTALLVATARIDLDPADGSEPQAALIAATYLAAGGAGTIVVPGATDAQRAELESRGPDTALASEPILDDDGRDRSISVVLPPRPVWWPAAEGAGVALAFWRGGLAATRWMSHIANK